LKKNYPDKSKTAELLDVVKIKNCKIIRCGEYETTAKPNLRRHSASNQLCATNFRSLNFQQTKVWFVELGLVLVELERRRFTCHTPKWVTSDIFEQK
jgi:hypothetical protein